MDKFIIPENERKPEKFPDIRSQKRKEKKKKKNLLLRSHSQGDDRR